MFRGVLIITTAVLLSCSGCASLTRGISQPFMIETEPSGVQATISTGQVCTTPCSLKLRRKYSFTVLLEKPGYVPITAVITPDQSADGSSKMVGNMLTGGFFGAAIDMNTGALLDLAPNPLRVSLQAVETDRPPMASAAK